MSVLLDPDCSGARSLRQAQSAQNVLLLSDSTKPTRLGLLVKERQHKELVEHKQACRACRAYTMPRCKSCGADLKAGIHAFLCAGNPHRWRDAFRLNWRRSEEPRAGAPATSRSADAAPRVLMAAEVSAREGAALKSSMPLREWSPRSGGPAVEAPRATKPAAASRPKLEAPPKLAPAPKPAAPKLAPAPRPAAAPKPAAAPRPEPKPQARPAPTAPQVAPEIKPKPKAKAAAKPPRADPYRVLGTAPDAEWDEIRRAYREKASQYHPDKVAHLAPEFREVAEKRMREINEAFDVMKRLYKDA